MECTRISQSSLMTMTEMSNPLRTGMERFGLELLRGQLSTLTITSMMFNDVKEKQDRDPELQRIRKGMQEDKYQVFA